eukprot:9272334-Pyramimonas_sp.AAC.1
MVGKYKERTKKRLFDIARLVIVARGAGKDDSLLLKEIACLQCMAGTAARLVDHLAESKQERDARVNRVKTLTTKMKEISDQRKEAE